MQVSNGNADIWKVMAWIIMQPISSCLPQVVESGINFISPRKSRTSLTRLWVNLLLVTSNLFTCYRFSEYSWGCASVWAWSKKATKTWAEASSRKSTANFLLHWCFFNLHFQPILSQIWKKDYTCSSYDHVIMIISHMFETNG